MKTRTKAEPYYAPTKYREVEVSLDDFSDEEIAKYLRHRGFQVTGEAHDGTPSGGGADDSFMEIGAEDLDRIGTLLLCGQRDAAREFAFDLISSEIGRRL